MIAITVFSIGVLAVLRLLTSNLVSMDKTEHRTIATFLAKEWLELIYNIRDANIQKWLPWNCLLTDKNLWIQAIWDFVDPNDACARYFSSGASDGMALSVWFSSTGYFSISPQPIWSDFGARISRFALMQMTWIFGSQQYSRYAPVTQVDTWMFQTFGRYILFTWVVEWNSILPMQDVLKVESHVLFVQWGSTGEIVLESLIWKQ